jgi:hypothetical protein
VTPSTAKGWNFLYAYVVKFLGSINMNEQIQLPSAFRVHARTAQEMQKYAAANMPESVKIEEKEVVLRKIISYVKNPFTLALTTWVVIAVLFLIDILSK